MGKPKDWRGNGSKQTWEATADRSWSIWPGAFSPQAPWKPRGGKGAQKEQGIPGYATRRPQEEQPNPAAPTNGASAKEGLVPTIQHALNYTRKAEARVKKVQDDKIKHVQMWQLWEADMKAAWLREKKRFAAEAERLEKEAGESLQAQADARCNLRAAFEACYRQRPLERWKSRMQPILRNGRRLWPVGTRRHSRIGAVCCNVLTER